MTTIAYAALWMFVFSLQCEDIVGLTSVGAISRVMGIPALGLTLMAVVVTGRVRRLHTFQMAALLFVACAACGLLFYYSDQELPRKFWTYLQLLLVIWMIWELAPTWRRVRGLLTAYVCGSYVAAIGTIMLYLQDADASRFSVGGGDANDLAMQLALALPMAWYLGITYNRPILKWICRAYLPLGIFAIGLTASRGGMLVGVVGLMIVPFTMTKLSPGKLAAALALLCISGALAVIYVPERAVERLSTTSNELESGRLGGRFKVWRAGLIAFAHRPVMGYGTSSFKRVAAPYGGLGIVAHNSFLSVLVEQGLVGFTFFAAMFISVFLSLRKLPLVERRFAFVLLATLCCAMLPLTWEDRKQVWFVLAALVGLAETPMARRALAQAQATRVMPRGRLAPRPQEPVLGPVRSGNGPTPA